MTSRQVFEYALVELNKVQAPSLLLEDYNYFINKAINQYINRVYNLYDVNQQKSDDLRVLKSSAILTPIITNDYETPSSALFSKTYEVNLPDDYLHILNCVVEYGTQSNFKCYNQGDKVHFGAKRLTADMFSQVINNFYMRPSYKNPYYYINNVNITDTIPGISTLTSMHESGLKADLHFKAKEFSTYQVGSTIKKNEYIKSTIDGIERTFFQCIKDYTVEIGSNPHMLPNNFIVIGDVAKDSISDPWVPFLYGPNLIQKEEKLRYGNNSRVRMEIRYGKDDATFKLEKIYIDYLKAPQFIRLTQEQVDVVEDNSQILEFPDYVVQEIINELVKLLMENASDPRLQTNIPINQSIANPAQEQQRR